MIILQKIGKTLRKNRLKKLFEYEIDQYEESKLIRIENTIEEYLEIPEPEPPKLITEEEANRILKKKNQGLDK